MRRLLGDATEVLPTLVSLASSTEIVEKATEAKLVDYVLSLLSGGLEVCEDPSACKAHGVKLLKKLAADPRLGLSIQQRLDEDRDWDNFKAQDHELFLAPDASGLLQHSGARVGLLTG